MRGLFVRLDESGVEGMAALESLGREWFDLDERTLSVTSASSGRPLRFGDRVEVEVVETDVIHGHFDFKIIFGSRTLH